MSNSHAVELKELTQDPKNYKNGDYEGPIEHIRADICVEVCGQEFMSRLWLEILEPVASVILGRSDYFVPTLDMYLPEEVHISIQREILLGILRNPKRVLLFLEEIVVEAMDDFLKNTECTIEIDKTTDNLKATLSFAGKALLQVAEGEIE